MGVRSTDRPGPKGPGLRVHGRPAYVVAGRIFWFTRNTFVGS